LRLAIADKIMIARTIEEWEFCTQAGSEKAKELGSYLVAVPHIL
jgi:hypothetical protein